MGGGGDTYIRLRCGERCCQGYGSENGVIRGEIFERNWKQTESVLSDRIKRIGENEARGARQTSPSPALSRET